MTLTTRKPTGHVPPPLVLLEGEEKAGKTYAALLLSASPQVGTTYVLDLGEGTADEYGAIPGADYLVIEHDGTYAAILQAVTDVRAEAQRVKDAGELPVVFVLDSATALWAGLKDWISGRAVKSPAGKRALAADPAAEVKPTMNLWNDAGTRHRKVMTLLLTFPGIVVITARGKEVALVEGGKPVEGQRTWSVDCHKDVPFDATLWVRLRRGRPAEVVGARSVHAARRPGKDDPQAVAGEHDDNLVEWLIFDVLQYDPAAGDVRQVQALDGGETTEEERGEEPRVTDAAWLKTVVRRLAAADTPGSLRGLYGEVGQVYADRKLTEQDGRMLKDAFEDRNRQLEAAAEVALAAARAKVAAQVPA